tara:strand:- start:7561 stop:8349 length:789 start_codon:yes stop_codon:yes gene_type:complete
MAKQPLQYWINKAEDFTSSAFVLLWKKSASATDIIIVNTANNVLSAYANYEGNISEKELIDFLKGINLKSENVAIKRLEDHHKTVLIPKSLFTKGEEQKIFGFNFSQTEGAVTAKEVFNAGHMLLFENSSNINGHLLEGILEYINVDDKEEVTLVYISYDYFVIVRKSVKGLSFVNSFEYQTSEDFIYYLLFTLEQLEFDNEKETLYYFGDFEIDSAIHKLIKQYFKNESLTTKVSNIHFPEELPQSTHHRLLPAILYLLCE